MFGIGLPELGVLLVVAALVLGPDKLPDLARQAAGLVRQLKALSDGARDELRSQLGPDYADLELRDLDPRLLVRKHVLSAIEGDWELRQQVADAQAGAVVDLHKHGSEDAVVDLHKPDDGPAYGAAS